MTTARAHLQRMVEAYSRVFLMTGTNVQFLRHMLERGALDDLARRTLQNPEWSVQFNADIGEFYRRYADYEPLCKQLSTPQAVALVRLELKKSNPTPDTNPR